MLPRRASQRRGVSGRDRVDNRRPPVLAAMYREEGPEVASRGIVDPELMPYIGQALAALRCSS
jgi:hypothetical protein